MTETRDRWRAPLQEILYYVKIETKNVLEILYYVKIETKNVVEIVFSSLAFS